MDFQHLLELAAKNQKVAEKQVIKRYSSKVPPPKKEPRPLVDPTAIRAKIEQKEKEKQLKLIEEERNRKEGLKRQLEAEKKAEEDKRRNRRSSKKNAEASESKKKPHSTSEKPASKDKPSSSQYQNDGHKAFMKKVDKEAEKNRTKVAKRETEVRPAKSKNHKKAPAPKKPMSYEELLKFAAQRNGAKKGQDEEEEKEEECKEDEEEEYEEPRRDRGRTNYQIDRRKEGRMGEARPKKVGGDKPLKGTTSFHKDSRLQAGVSDRDKHTKLKGGGAQSKMPFRDESRPRSHVPDKNNAHKLQERAALHQREMKMRKEMNGKESVRRDEKVVDSSRVKGYKDGGKMNGRPIKQDSGRPQKTEQPVAGTNHKPSAGTSTAGRSMDKHPARSSDKHQGRPGPSGPGRPAEKREGRPGEKPKPRPQERPEPQRGPSHSARPSPKQEARPRTSPQGKMGGRPQGLDRDRPRSSMLPPISEVSRKRPAKPPIMHVKRGRVLASDSEESDYDDLDGFIDDTPAEDMECSNVSGYIKEIFGYDKSKYGYESDFSLRFMDASFRDIQKEEARSTRLGMLEDLEDMRMEKEQMNKKKTATKKGKKR